MDGAVRNGARLFVLFRCIDDEATDGGPTYRANGTTAGQYRTSHCASNTAVQFTSEDLK
jgi:hypothetical protein